jgi:hypothetical protein
MDSSLVFLDCPAYLDRDGSQRCGLPAEMRCRFIMRSTDRPLDSAMIRCPAGHWFNGPIEFLTLKTEPGDRLKAAQIPAQQPVTVPAGMKNAGGRPREPPGFGSPGNPAAKRPSGAGPASPDVEESAPPDPGVPGRLQRRGPAGRTATATAEGAAQ